MNSHEKLKRNDLYKQIEAKRRKKKKNSMYYANGSSLNLAKKLAIKVNSCLLFQVNAINVIAEHCENIVRR